MRPGSTRARVLEAAKGLQQASLKQIYELTGLTAEAERARAYRAVRELMGEGRLARKGVGLYVYRDVGPRRPREVLGRMWRAMCASREGFTSRDISDIASASRDHTKKVITWLKKNGAVRVVGRRAMPGVDTRFNVYQVVPERRGREVPRYSRPRKRTRDLQREWEPLKTAALEIVSQVCGLPMGDAEKLRELEAAAERFLGRVRGVRVRVEARGKGGR